jgi:CDP-diacylglycerol pyrophosphatase
MRSVALLCALWLVSLTSLPSRALSAVACSCDVSKPVTLKQHSCSLCVVTEKQPVTVLAYSLKDNSKLKPNRWLALPRVHTTGRMEMLADLSPESRTALWREAIARGQLLWGEHWGLAMNGVVTRTQCHLHIHIGRLIDGVEYGDFTVVDEVAQIPDPGEMGMWVHPVGGKLHVHREMSAETVLLR